MNSNLEKFDVPREYIDKFSWGKRKDISDRIGVIIDPDRMRSYISSPAGFNDYEKEIHGMAIIENRGEISSKTDVFIDAARARLPGGSIDLRQLMGRMRRESSQNIGGNLSISD